MADVADRSLKEHVATRRKSATLRLYRLAINTHVKPLLGTVAIADVTRADVVRLHHRLRPTRVMGNRVLAVLSKLMNWAEQQGYRAARSNPCRGVEKYREQARRRYLTLDEMKRLGAALRIGERWHTMSPTAVTALRLLLLTGARVSEILSLRWREVDLARGTLQLPDSKTGRKTILLSVPAIDILTAWPRFSGPYVFPGEGRGVRKGKHRVSLADAWSWIRRRARIPDVRIHDLRHSFASVAVSGGQTLPIIGALLGHSQAAAAVRTPDGRPVTRSKQRHGYDDRRCDRATTDRGNGAAAATLSATATSGELVTVHRAVSTSLRQPNSEFTVATPST